MFSDELRSLRRCLEAMARDGGTVRPLRVGSPARDDQVREVERVLGVELPSSFRTLLLEFASQFDFAWFAHPERTFPAPFASNFSGALLSAAIA